MVSGTKPVGDHETTVSEQSDERNAIECGILILGNEMRSLRHGLRREKMIEGIAVMKRKSRTSDKMRICNIQPIESLTRQNRKNLYIGIKLPASR